MKNEEDLFIFPWGTNVSRLNNSLRHNDDDHTITVLRAGNFPCR